MLQRDEKLITIGSCNISHEIFYWRSFSGKKKEQIMSFIKNCKVNQVMPSIIWFYENHRRICANSFKTLWKIVEEMSSAETITLNTWKRINLYENMTIPRYMSEVMTCFWKIWKLFKNYIWEQLYFMISTSTLCFLWVWEMKIRDEDLPTTLTVLKGKPVGGTI